MSIRSFTIATVLMATVPLAAPGRACEAHHVAVAPAEIAWKPGPGSLPRGAEVAVIEGDPAQAGPFTMRLRFPAGYRIPVHTHPAIEHITVLSGVFNIGAGDELDPGEGRAMPAGSFVVMPVGHPHHVWIEEATIVQLHGVGPWGIAYLDPADDPRPR